MEEFLNWDILSTYASFVTIVFMVVEFTKDLKGIKKIPTKYWSFVISLVLMIITNIALGTFSIANVILYALSSMAISLGSNGLNNFNKKKDGE